MTARAYDLPTFPPYLERFRDLQVADRAQWTKAASQYGSPVAMSVVHVDRVGSSVVHHVNAVDPGTTGSDYYAPPGDMGRVVPAGRGFR